MEKRKTVYRVRKYVERVQLFSSTSIIKNIVGNDDIFSQLDVA